MMWQRNYLFFYFIYIKSKRRFDELLKILNISYRYVLVLIQSAGAWEPWKYPQFFWYFRLQEI